MPLDGQHQRTKIHTGLRSGRIRAMSLIAARSLSMSDMSW